MNAALRIFTSSTFQDLTADRRAVRDVVEALRRAGAPVEWVGMEAFGAISSSPLIASEEFAEHADLVILLLGDRYGSEVPEEKFSFTHAEWNVIRRNRIPCLAYLKQTGEAALGKEIAELRRQVGEEIVTTSYTSPADLAEKVQCDLERELASVPVERDPVLVTTFAPAGGTDFFTGRTRELTELLGALDGGETRIGVRGPPGIGKTTFVRQAFANARDFSREPLWLKVDELFATDAAGRRRIGGSRWQPDPLLKALLRLNADRPRGIFVFDNVQAAPLLVRWLEKRLAGVRCVFLAWDAEALPPCSRVIRLGSLARGESLQFFRQRKPAGTQERESLDRLCEMLGDYPLLLDFAARRLIVDESLTFDELATELGQSEKLLAMQGPTLDQVEVQVRRLFVSSYLRLELGERQALSALAAVPPEGISVETMAWAAGTFSNGKEKRISRAVALGFIEGRTQPDWRGHRYYVRTIIRDFLKTTDAYAEGLRSFQRYLGTREVFDDTSIDVATIALNRQLEASITLPRGGDWWDKVLLESRPALRARVFEALRRVREPVLIEALASELAGQLTRPRLEQSILTALQLLADWRDVHTEAVVRRIWRTPRVRDESGEVFLLDSVRTAAARALAALRGQSLADFVASAMRSGIEAERLAALDCAGNEGVRDIQDAVIAALDDTSLRVRQRAVEAIGSYQSEERLVDLLWRRFREESHEQTRKLVAFALAIWKDERIVPTLLDLLAHPDADTRAHAVSVLWRFPRADVAERLAELALSDRAEHVRQNALFALADFRDPRAADVALAQIGSADARTALIAMFSVARFADSLVAGSTRDALCTRLCERLSSPSIDIRLVARTALLALREQRGYDGLWDDIRDEASRRHPTFRWSPLGTLATWRPANFDAESLRFLLHDADPAMRRMACLVAGQARAADLAAELESLLDDDSFDELDQKTIGSLASEALDRIAGTRPPWEPHPNSRKPTHA